MQYQPKAWPPALRNWLAATQKYVKAKSRINPAEATLDELLWIPPWTKKNIAIAAPIAPVKMLRMATSRPWMKVEWPSTLTSAVPPPYPADVAAVVRAVPMSQ